MSNNKKLICLLLKAQKIEKPSEQGYAMVVVSILSIIMFSLLAASLVFSNLAKSRTDAFVDSQSSFAVAESGLNKRAVEFRNILNTYSGVREISELPGSTTLSSCFAAGASSATPSGTDYLACRNYSYKSRDNAATVAGKGGGISISNNADEAVNEYMAYTAISKNDPQLISIPSTEDFAGLNAVEYKYVLNSTAKKPVKSEATVAGNAAKSSNNIELSMTFTNRVISLFQFAIFYNGDLEFNSTSPMQVKGWVHSNANIYVQPAGVAGFSSDSVTTFLAKVSAVGSIYNRVDAWVPGIGRTGITRVLLTGDDCSIATNCQNISAYAPATTTPLSSTEIATFQSKLQAGISRLKTPPAGFTRKRSYATNKIGEYYAKADMRLDFVPNRGTSPAVIPFNFTAMTTTGAGTCSTAAPVAGSDPDANYVDPNREGSSTLKCNQLTKGQLQSLRQPVLVLTTLNQTSALAGQENTALGAPETFPTAPAFSTLASLNDTPTNRNKILRALQVAIVSNPTPISLDLLDNPLSDPSFTAVRAEFLRLLDIMFPVPPTGTPTLAQQANQADKIALLASSPNQIAALRNAWFLPAPIQRVITTAAADPLFPNPTGSGFYDGRELRWISVLQTNIASLAVWNRDGLYVTANDTTMTSAYAASTGNRDLAFNDATAASYSTSGLAFDRATTIPSTPKGLQSLGLGSIDSTEGGLVLHASVNDDLDGDGSIAATTDITGDTTKPIEETTIDLVTGVSTTTTIDYLRKYPGVTVPSTLPYAQKSPFAFAFTGGDYLPNNLLLSSDQAIYVQGNFNNNNNDGNAIPASTPNTSPSASATRLSASIVADTITVLSNDCISRTTVSALGVPAGQVNCGIPVAANLVGSPMVINAAFLSNTDASIGNYQGVVGETLPAEADRRYSGGVNNYIRLLEDWNNGGTGSPWTLNYMGSMISLGAPLEYSGQYRPGGDIASALGVTPVVLASYYNIPFRSFSYDPNFNSVDRMPPLTPKASYIQQKNFSRKY